MRNEAMLILATSWDPNLEEFLAALGISRGSLGEQLFEGVFNALFRASIEAKDEFKRFYSLEYASLAEYLEIRYGQSVPTETLAADGVYLVSWMPQLIDNTYDGNVLQIVLDGIKKLERG